MRILSGAVLLVAALLIERLALQGVWMLWKLMLYLPAYFAVGYDVLWRALRNLFRGQVFDENFLMTIATVGALLLGFLPGAEAELAEAVFVMLFYQVGELFQSIAVGKSRRLIAALMDIRPALARVERDGTEVELAPEEVAVGEVLVIRPGERIPLDGVVVGGSSDVNTLALTGEAEPRSVTVGEEVISGCINLTGLLRVLVKKPFSLSTVSQILQLMQEMGERKAASERFITRFAKYYTPLVVVAALCVALLPPMFAASFSAALTVWLARALTFLVISCPCALVISVPLSFFGGIGGASRMGVLVKGAQGLEALSGVEEVIFDKTGTLTEGRFAVVAAFPVGIEADELLRLAAAVEQGSNHPVAGAICAAAEGSIPTAEQVREVAGKGICAVVNGQTVAVGNAAMMTEQGIRIPAFQEDETAVFVTRCDTYLGYIALRDAPKSGAREAVSMLRHCGVRRITVLTGDRKAVADRVAAELGVDACYSELLPTQKVERLEAALRECAHGAVAFVGDGINDAPVLARADVGIAMGALGSDVAVEAADVVLMDDDPRKVARAVRHARRTVRIVRQNILLALGVKLAVLACIALGLLGALQMPLAIFADVGVAVLAILNAMRALRTKA